jgi:non-canonical (house-cleaning) NTP pyrophosphatase
MPINTTPLIAVGTTSDQKIQILRSVLEHVGIAAEIIPCDVSSDITDQPLDEETTLLGATNRSLHARACVPTCDISLGLEGGLIDTGDVYELICIAVMHTAPQNTHVGVSTRRPLPKSVSDEIRNGGQFGEYIRSYYNQEKYLTEGFSIEDIEELISREKSFSEAVLKSLSLTRLR